MKNFWVIAFCVMVFYRPLESTVLQERMANAKIGDYIVTESNKMISVVAIRSVSEKSIILEEINVPSHAVNPPPPSWPEWVRLHAPGHTSWSMIEIDFENHQLMECYSFSRSAWVELSMQESFISTIMGLDFQQVPLNEQRRIGPEPLSGESDTRKIWKPPLIQNGNPVESIEFEVYQAAWPKDGSEFAGNFVSFYFDKEGRSPFPAWIQMATSHAIASIRMIDSGSNLPAHYRTLPRRVPEFIDAPQKTHNGLLLTVKSPRYYRHFDLFAVDISCSEKEIFPISHTLIAGEGETLHLQIANSDLKNTLQPNHRYTWLIVPNGHCEHYSESTKPFLWKE